MITLQTSVWDALSEVGNNAKGSMRSVLFNLKVVL